VGETDLPIDAPVYDVTDDTGRERVQSVLQGFCETTRDTDPSDMAQETTRRFLSAYAEYRRDIDQLFLAALRRMPREELAEFVAPVLTALGLENVKLDLGETAVDRSLRGLATIWEGDCWSTVHILIDRSSTSLRREAVKDACTILGSESRAIIITTGTITAGVKAEGERIGHGVVTLIGGTRLCEICLESGVGFTSQMVDIPSIDLRPQ